LYSHTKLFNILFDNAALFGTGATLSEIKISQGLKHLEILILDEADRLLRWDFVVNNKKFAKSPIVALG
jgi:hypothetical protein